MVANNPTKLRPVAYATESAAARRRSSGDTAVSRYGATAQRQPLQVTANMKISALVPPWRRTADDRR